MNMEEIFRQRKAICPRCKSWEYCRFRYMNNKGRAKKMQPRYRCDRCRKCFTLGGKLYNTSLNRPSRASISPKRPCLPNIFIASPPCRSSCDQWTLHAPASSNSYCKPMTSIGGTCNTFQRAHGEICCQMKPGLRVQSYGTYSENNLCCGNFVNPYNIIKEDICSGMLGTCAQLPYDGSSQWAELPYDRRPPAERLPFTFLQTSQEHTMAGNHSLNNIPLFNNIGPVEPFEVFQDVDLLLSESLAEKTANVKISEFMCYIQNSLHMSLQLL
jgi:hypothetical protein